MVDIPFFLEEKVKERNAEFLKQIIVRLASNGRVMEDKDYQELLNGITQALGSQELTNEFSREKLEELRMMTNMGANRV